MPGGRGDIWRCARECKRQRFMADKQRVAARLIRAVRFYVASSMKGHASEAVKARGPLNGQWAVSCCASRDRVPCAGRS
jgi:hypothetical protein